MLKTSDRPDMGNTVPSSGSSEEERQKSLYNRIFAEYDRHYGDRYSREYRKNFIYEPLFGQMDLRGKRVLDAMCGGGYTTEYLISRGALVDGLDISDEAMRAYAERWKGARTRCASILQTGAADSEYDCVAIIGGLHHTHPDIDKVLHEIHRILKPGGSFCFYEPHAHSVFDRIRKIWYRNDSFFAENEAAIDFELLKRENARRFRFATERYCGSCAYLLVLNSAVWRMPPALKSLYSPLLLWAETGVSPWIPRAFSFTVLARWEKLP